MRGIPKNIATSQDVLNLCNDLPPGKAQIILGKHKNLLKTGDYLDLKKILTAKKRGETMQQNRAKRQWTRLHELEASIPAINDKIVGLVSEIRQLTKKQNKAKAEKTELELLIKHGRT